MDKKRDVYPNLKDYKIIQAWKEKEEKYHAIENQLIRDFEFNVDSIIESIGKDLCISQKGKKLIEYLLSDWIYDNWDAVIDALKEIVNNKELKERIEKLRDSK